MGMLKEEVKGNQHGHTLKLKLGEGNKGSDGEKGKQAKDAPNDRKTINIIATRKRPTSPQLQRGDLKPSTFHSQKEVYSLFPQSTHNH
ncbi:hypothetical protein GOBAR_DD34297 [Gossypium barbadense]|nr:hypothetical protein GOBAR_DD34297 [Gossypium barbadense]